MNITTIFNNNKDWINSKLKNDINYFKKLAKKQNPKILYIGCSDSRVTAEEIMGLSLGEIFVHRNIANLISNTDISTISTINFAVSHLKVRHIIVCGHYNCNGIKAAMKDDDLGILNFWLDNIRDIYRLHKKKLDAINDETQRYNKLAELNVKEQCINLIKKHEVKKALHKKHLAIHGWIFDLSSGKLIDLGFDYNKILKKNNI